MSRRGEIIRAFVETGFVSSEAARIDADSQITVTVHFLRKHGFPVKTLWGVGYRLAPEHRERLAQYPWAVQAMTRDEVTTSLIIELPRSTIRVLGAIAEERGRSIATIASLCVEAGLDSQLEASS